MRVSSIASDRCAGSCVKPGARTVIACGMNNSASASSTICDTNSSVKMWFENSFAAVSPLAPET